MTASSFGFSEPEESPGFLLWQTTVSWQRLIKQALEPYQIAHSHFVILALLLWCEESKQEPIQSFLVSKSKLDKMTVSQAMKKLSALKLIKRQEHSSDTRAKTISLTAKGKALIKKLIPIVEGVDQDFFGALQGKEEKQLRFFLNQLVSNDIS